MKHLFRSAAFFSLSLAFPLAAFASASSVADILGVDGNKEVTRGEFLRASVILLGLSVDTDAPPRQYRVYPEGLQAYVRAADEAGALDALGARPDLSKVITRGEAVRLVAELRTWKGTGAVLSFRDVDANTELGAAVKLSAQKSWTKPLRKNVFGVNAVLRAKEARTLLTRAATDAGERTTQTIKISSKRADPVGYNSKKFRDQIHNLLKNEYLYAAKLETATGSTAESLVKSIDDPYTTLFNPTAAKEFQDQLSGTITGIGVHLDDEEFQIMSVIEGSPAARAGLLAGDKIVSVNKKRTEGMSLDNLISRIRGKKGTPVRIGVSRAGDELSFDMIRAPIDIPDSKYEMRSNVAIVTISQFGDHLIKDAATLFDDVAAKNPEGVVLDLRYNPGGYLQAVPSVLGEFLPNGTVYLYTKGKNFQDEYVTRGEPTMGVDLPLVVLVNEGTASSAEIVAGALQDHGRATIIGKKTFGKGTVQTVIPFQNKSSIKFTIAEWLTPDEHPINDIGITPDEEVSQNDAGDAQLERALDIIRQASR